MERDSLEGAWESLWREIAASLARIKELEAFAAPSGAELAELAELRSRIVLMRARTRRWREVLRGRLYDGRTE